jgi:hypothetical protein
MTKFEYKLWYSQNKDIILEIYNVLTNYFKPSKNLYKDVIYMLYHKCLPKPYVNFNSNIPNEADIEYYTNSEDYYDAINELKCFEHRDQEIIKLVLNRYFICRKSLEYPPEYDSDEEYISDEDSKTNLNTKDLGMFDLANQLATRASKTIDDFDEN